MPRPRVYRFNVRLRTTLGRPGVGDFGGFIDMMRYDGARVITSSHPEPDTFQITLETTDRPPTAARWASFGLTIQMEQ